MNHSEPFLNPPGYMGPLRSEQACVNRKFQGIPAIERAPNGRLWAAWYGGGVTEDRHNYVLLATTVSAQGPWEPPSLVIDPDGEGPVRAYDPCLWHDPQGRLWFFWSQGYEHHTDGRAGVWAIRTSDSACARPKWTAPERLFDGVMMNKPTVRSNGEWLFPVARWRREGSAGVWATRDGGRTWEQRGSANIPNPDDRNCDEHMILERRDGSLWMWVRTRYGIGHSESRDGGWTWTPVEPSSVPHTASRFFIRRLRSGRLLLVKHGGLEVRTERSHLTAFLSEDDGTSWKGGLLIDERLGVSYPDGVEDEEGVQYLIYDFDRKGAKEIRLAVFDETAVLRGGHVETVVVHKAGVTAPSDRST